MLTEDKYFQTLTEDELWQRYCGFLDLSIDEFMQIQKQLLMDEIERVADSVLGKKIMGNRIPKSVEEFRRTLPLTTYDDYEPYLSERQEDVLATKPYAWLHSAGRMGSFKWIPHSEEAAKNLSKTLLSGLILASATQRGQINIKPGFRMLAVVPPPDYPSGFLLKNFADHFHYELIPDPEKTKKMDMREKMQYGFQTALKKRVDVIGSIGSVLAKMGEGFGGQAQGMKFQPYMLHPMVLGRLLGAWVRSKRQKRAVMPKDLWPVKVLMTGGVDTAIYKDTIAHYWGSEPWEGYVCTEVLFLAIQYWNKKEMVFVPDFTFLEFIPYEEQLQHQNDKDYQPSTVLLNEVEEGKLYEVVITQFYGMPLLRYRLRDLIKVVALRDDKTGVILPHIVFQRRMEEVINLGGLAQLDEKTMWRAIVNSEISHTDWVTCKEYDRGQAYLRLYIELKEDKGATEIETAIDEQLKILDLDYRDVYQYLELQPIRVTVLAPGTFQRYVDKKVKEGADPAHWKPTHVNPPDEIIRHLLEYS